MNENYIISRINQILFNRYHLCQASQYVNPVEVPELSTDYLTTTLYLQGDKLIIKTDTSEQLKQRGVALLPSPFVFACGKKRKRGDVFLNDQLRLITGYRICQVIKRALSELKELKFEKDKYCNIWHIITEGIKIPEALIFRWNPRPYDY